MSGGSARRGGGSVRFGRWTGRRGRRWTYGAGLSSGIGALSVVAALDRADQLAQAAEPRISVAHVALDPLQDVRRRQVRLVDHLVDRAAGAPAVVPVGAQRVLLGNRSVDPVTHELEGSIGHGHAVPPVRGRAKLLAV